MAQDATIISASLNDNELKNSIDKLVRYVDEGTRKMSQSMTDAVAEMKKALQSLGDTKIDFGVVADGGSSKRTKKQQEETQAVNNTSVSYDRLADSMQRASQYSNEILKKSKAIRESSEWMETGHYTSGDTVFYDKDRANVSKRERSQLLSLEEQIEAALLQQEETRRMSARESVRQAQAEQQVTQAASGTQQIYQSIYEMQLRSNEEARKGGIKNTSFANYEDFRQALAGVLGLQKNEVILANEETDAYNKLRATLGQLESVYYNLSSAERESDNGKSLVASIQEVQRAIQKIRSDVARPLSLQSVMGLSEKTLDDIAYKMQMLQRYRSGLNVDTQRNEINQVNQAYDSLKKKMDEVMAKSAQMNTMNNALARSFNYMKNRLAFYFTVGASTAFVKTLIDIRSQYEMNERALGILITSAEKGTQVFNELSQMSLVSPYTLIELTNAARQLTAYGVAARDVVDTTRRLADVAAAVGAPIERISYALGHVQSYGYLTSLQARQFANSGIPLVKELANRYSELEGRLVTTADVYDRMKKKQVEYADVMDVINKMTDEGGRFFDFQAKMADTLKVRLANLNLAWNNMLNDMGKSSQGLLTWTIGSLRTLFTHWKQLDQAIKSAAWAGGLIVAVRALNVLLVKAGANFGILSASMTTTQIAGKGLASTLGNIIGGFKALVTTPLTWWSLLAFAIVDAWRDLKNLNEAQKEFNKSLRDAGNNNTKSLTDFYNQYNGGAKKISADDAKKVWEEMREQIELTVKKSDMFVGSLLRIDDVSKRLKVGFELINDINEVNAALKELDDDSIKMEADFSKWWNLNLWPDGLVENIQNYTKAQKELYEYSMKGESLSKMEEDAKKLKDRFLDLQGAISITTGSIYDLIKIKGWEGNINKINALYDQVLGNLAEKYNLSPSEAFNMQMAAEKSRSIATEKALQIRLADEEAALKVATEKETRNEIQQRKSALEQEFRFFVQNTDESRVYWRDFTNWIKTQHLAETQAMFKGMNAEQIKSLNFQKGKYFEWIDRLTKQYAKEHNKTYSETFDLLRNYVTNANQMSIFIPLVIGTDKKKSLYEELTGADSDIDAAQKKIERLTQRRNELLEKGGRMSNDKKVVDDTIRAEEELAQAQKDYNDALEKGGHLKDKQRKNSKKDPVLDSLKTEISLVEKLQGDYEKLTKAGASSKDALKAIHNAYGSTIDLLNKNLQGFGLPRLDLSMITGKNPNEQLNYFKELKSLLESKGLANLERIKALDAVIEKLNVKAETYNLDMVTKGLNNELGKLKEEYELGVEFDANPELGDVFADMMGINKDKLKELPRTFEQFVEKAQERINKLFEEKGIDLKFNLKNSLNLSNFEDWVTASGQTIDSELVKNLRSYVEQANKIRLDETKKQIDDWNKLLEKYAQYEYKKLQIEKEYQREMEVARGKKATSDLTRAITNKRDRDIAKVNFEQFQQSPTWIAATGDLATMTSSALGLLIKRIEEYKRTANNLSDKEIKSINNALRKLHQQQRRENPFLSIKASMEEAKQLYEDYQEKIDDAGYRIDELNAKRQKGSSLTEAETKELADLVEQIEFWKQEQEALGKVSLNTILQGLSKMKDFATSVTGAVGDIFAAFGDEETQEVLNGVTSALDKATQFSAMGAQVGGVWGAAAGAALGLFSGLVSSLGDILSGNRAITKQIQESERSVKRLQNAYKDLEQQVEEAYGAMIVGAQRAEIANKKAQLDELKRQLELERSRNSKYYDEEKIIDLQGQIKDLENEISEMTKSIVTDLLGISSVGDAAEQLVSSMIDAFRKGEDYMIHFDETFEDMIDNMIMKAIVSRVIGDRIQNLFDMIDQRGKDRAAEYANDIDKLTKRRQAFEDEIEEMQGTWSFQMLSDADKAKIRASWQKTLEDFDKRLQELQEAYANAMAATPEDVESVREYASNMRDSVQSEFEAWMAAFGIKYGEGAEGSKLSNLQQGIQGITEDTANALEAYMNGVSQQVYLHSDLLTQIRDTLVGFDMDVQTATQAQILLQLQQSYAVQMSIQSMLQGWSNASGMAVRVEMI